MPGAKCKSTGKGSLLTVSMHDGCLTFQKSRHGRQKKDLHDLGHNFYFSVASFMGEQVSAVSGWAGQSFLRCTSCSVAEQVPADTTERKCSSHKH